MIRIYNVICVLGIVLAGFEVNAQQTIWSENFQYSSTGGFPAGWKSYGWGCDYDVYIQTNCAPRTGNQTRVAGVSGYTIATGFPCEYRWKNQTDLLLQTPLIDLRGTQHPRLTFDSYFLRYRKNGRYERAAVQVSADSGATWTVLKEVPPATFGSFNTCQVDLSNYTAGSGAIRIGFFYTDSLEYMPGWLIDNFEISESLSSDIALVGTSQDDSFRSFHVVPASVPLEGLVVNYGAAPVSGFTAYWQDGGGSVHSTTISGISLKPLDTFRFTHSDPLDLSTTGKHALRMWVSAPGDLRTANDERRFSVSGCLFRPRKKLVIEEGTGNWNISAPVGDVLLHQLDTAADPPIRISAHSGDVLEYKPYSDHLYNLDQLFTHFFMFDRRGGVHKDAFPGRVAEDGGRFGFADLDMKISYSAGVLSLDVDVQPAVDLPGTYSLAMVVTEDNVRGTGKPYEQANGYSGSKAGTMGGYENKPNPVPAADMRYDYVVRLASPGPEGRAGAIAANPKAGQRYAASFLANIGLSWKKQDLNVITMLIRDSDSSIINANMRRLSSLSAGTQIALRPDARLQPNPARESTRLHLDLPRPGSVQVRITDISGRLVATPVDQSLPAGEHRWTLPTSGLAAGMYLVRITGPGFQESLKLSVVR